MPNTKSSVTTLLLLALIWTPCLRAQPREMTDLERALALGQKLEVCLKEHELNSRRLVEACEIKLTSKDARHAIRLDAVEAKHAVRAQALREKLTATEKARIDAEAAAERAWFESPVMWAGVGLFAGIALTVGVAAAVR